MVKNCSISHYSNEDEEIYRPHFEKYPYPLSIFQKHAIQGIVEGNHVLVTAHTGSGKTLACEFALEYFVSKGKKVIYTSPIKSLTNEKFYNFTKKFPHISFGILTGDVKSNPEAQVLLVTAEILLNKLYQKNANNSKTSENAKLNISSFDMDIENDLACVVMDEVHYINDHDRGKTWEETIIMLPHHVQMVMLSATIDAPEKFAHWCEQQHPTSNKTVYLASTYERIVPLTHYAFVTSPTALFKTLKDKTKEDELKQQVFNKMLTIQTSGGSFQEPTFHILKNTLQLLNTKQVFVKRALVLNQVCKHMAEHNMLPALCFVFSRKSLEQCAHEITVPLLEDDSKVGYIVEQECEQIIRKLPNYKEYLNLPEYINIVSLLQKGIAIHHAGIMPVLKEMVELLYSKGYIKLLFCTETLGVGVNMPTKSVIFTDICKFDGNSNRILYPHEASQISGRAGRRNIDVVGNVIYLPNLYRDFELTSFRNMLKGIPQKLTSKFKISYNLIFNIIFNHSTAQPIIHTTINHIKQYVSCSMIQTEINSEINGIDSQIFTLKEEIDAISKSFTYLRTPRETVQTYLQLLEERPRAVNKKRKEVERAIQQIIDDHKFIEKDKLTVIKYNEKCAELKTTIASYTNATQYVDNNIKLILELLVKLGFLFLDNSTESDSGESTYELTTKGSYAIYLRETNCLIFAKMIEDCVFNSLSSKQLAMIFSCFTNVTVSDDQKQVRPQSSDKQVQTIIETTFSSLQYHLKEENDIRINTGANYDMHFDLIDYVAEWWECDNEQSCKAFLQKLALETGIFLGEFVKALLKINNISTELEHIAELFSNVDLLHKLNQISANTLKFVATNQSLYI